LLGRTRISNVIVISILFLHFHVTLQPIHIHVVYKLGYFINQECGGK
jgi:hypothetical protein